jgi:hypothetical protein
MIGRSEPHGQLPSHRMNVFDDFERTDLDFAAYGEGNFSFLNRSTQPKFADARQIIENWFSHYPTHGQAELASRFRDKNTPQSFDSAFFELFLHEFFVRGGFRVEVHPQSSRSSRRPDFLITTPSDRRVYLEAIVATGVSKDEKATQSRIDSLYNALNQVVSPDFFIIVQHYNFEPTTPIPVSRVRKEVQRWIDGLDYEQVMALPKSDSFDDLPNYFVEHDEMTANLVAFPKKREARGLPDVPAVGGSSGAAFWDRAHEDIRSAVKKKRASRYDLGGLPYVVAVRCQDAFTRPSDVERALYGLRSGGGKQDLTQLAIADVEEGIWARRRGATNTSISGVLSVQNLYSWSLRETMVCLYQNPWATKPVNGEELAVTDASLTEEGVMYRSRDHLQRFS